MLRTSFNLVAIPCLTAVLALAPLAFAEKAEKGKAVIPFNGKDLDGWKFKHSDKSKWTVGKAELDSQNLARLAIAPGAAGGEMINPQGGSDIYTEEKFGDCRIELEFMVPKGSNSGIYLMGEYEIQILDSYGKEKVGTGDLGGLYANAAPKVNAAKKPGEWQKFVIDLQAPRFEDGKKVANAKLIKAVLNDQVIHEDQEIKGPTPSGVTGKEAPTGPLMFQGDHGPVAFRNIRITPRSSK